MKKTSRLPRFPVFPGIVWFGLVAAAWGLAVRSGHGVESTRQSNPSSHRIVSLSPHITDLLFALGAEEDIVGVSDYCRFPEGKPPKPKCGGLLNPNMERILALQPDTILYFGRMDRLQDFAVKHHIKTVSVAVDSYPDLKLEIQRMGRELGKEEAARRLSTQLEERFKKVRSQSAGYQPYQVLLLIGREPGDLKRLMSVSGQTFIGEMLEAANGRNVFSSNRQGYFTTSLESILEAQPEVVFELCPGQELKPGDEMRMLKDWQAVPSLSAVKHQRVVVMTNDFITIPGPRMVEIAELFQARLRGFARKDGRLQSP